MKIFISKISMLLFLAFGAFNLTAQQWEGSTGLTGNVNRSGRIGIGVETPLQMIHTSGNLRTDGRQILFGETQALLGNNGSAFVMKSNHESIAQVIFRNNLNENSGRIIGTSDYFGLKDADNQWVYLTRKGHYSQLRVSNVPALTARLFNIAAEGEEEELVTRVGIGITVPAKDFHVRGEARIDRLFINTSSSGDFDTEEYYMFVDGKAAFEEVRVQLSQHWGDYVFADDYKPMSLLELKNYVNVNKHLPNMPKASVLEEKGMELSDIVAKQMVNIEELVLYTIEQEEKIETLEGKLLAQQKEIDTIKAMLLKKN